MIEITGNIWSFWETGQWVAITTNGIIKKDGCAVMGKGVALQAAQKMKFLPKELGQKLKSFGNSVYKFPQYRVYTFPTKHHWRDNSDLKLIEKSCLQLQTISTETIYLPRPGCKNGGLTWEQVKPILQDILTDDRFIIVEYR